MSVKNRRLSRMHGYVHKRKLKSPLRDILCKGCTIPKANRTFK